MIMGCQGRKCRNSDMISAQFYENHAIKEKNIELEDKIMNLQQQVKEMARQLEEYKNENSKRCETGL